jgi:hypothetical protein
MRILLLLLCLIPSLLFGEANFKPLSEHVARGKNADGRWDEAEFSYVMARCASLYGVLAGNLHAMGKPETKETVNKLKEQSMQFGNISIYIGRKLKMTDEELIKRSQVINEFYKKEIVSSIRSPNNDLSPFLYSDIEVAKKLYADIEKLYVK